MKINLFKKTIVKLNILIKILFFTTDSYLTIGDITGPGDGIPPEDMPGDKGTPEWLPLGL